MLASSVVSGNTVVKKLLFRSEEVYALAEKELTERKLVFGQASDYTMLAVLQNGSDTQSFHATSVHKLAHMMADVPMESVLFVLQNVYSHNGAINQLVLPTGYGEQLEMQRSFVFNVRFGVDLCTNQLVIVSDSDKPQVRISRKATLRWTRVRGNRVEVELGDKLQFLVPYTNNEYVRQRLTYVFSVTLP
jgi:hypothetical protein